MTRPGMNRQADEDLLSDLLRPSLSARDDLVDFQHPWNPQTIILLTFLCGSVAGGILLAFNARRLGLRREFLPFLLGGVILALGIPCLLFFGIGPLLRHWHPDYVRLLARLVRTLTPVTVAWFASGPQRRRYRLARTSGVPLGGLWKPGLIACGAGFAVEMGIYLGLFALFQAIVTR